MTRVLALVALIALGACSPPPPPTVSGPWSALNQGQWTATQAEIEALPK